MTAPKETFTKRCFQNKLPSIDFSDAGSEDTPPSHGWECYKEQYMPPPTLSEVDTRV